MATTQCSACMRKFEAQMLRRLNNQIYCVDCFNVAKAKEQSK